MTPQQINLVQSSWQDIAEIAHAAAPLFYERLFTLDPSLQKLFRGDMTEQGRRLLAMIGMAVAGLRRLDTLIPAVEALGRRHAGYGVKDEHYATVGSALLWTLEQGLGERFTPAMRDAWAEVYGVLASAMRAASRVEAKAA